MEKFVRQKGALKSQTFHIERADKEMWNLQNSRVRRKKCLSVYVEISSFLIIPYPKEHSSVAMECEFSPFAHMQVCSKFHAVVDDVGLANSKSQAQQRTRDPNETKLNLI